MLLELFEFNETVVCVIKTENDLKCIFRGETFNFRIFKLSKSMAHFQTSETYDKHTKYDTYFRASANRVSNKKCLKICCQKL